jgi:2-keto-4-pentenoate hydratase/2-oxohepta-3-ene-1,7-dioic acid hydratase in catechol pathway
MSSSTPSDLKTVWRESLKFLRFDEGRTGLLLEGPTGHEILDVEASIAGSAPEGTVLRRLLADDGRGSWLPLIEAWDEAEPALAALLAAASAGDTSAVRRPLAGSHLRPPLADPSCRIFAIGGNFAQHVAAASDKSGGRAGSASFFAEEKAQGMPPWGFPVYNDTLSGQDATVTPPAGIRKLDYEAEVAIVLHKGGKQIGEEEVRIWGYTGWNDLSIRDPRVGIAPLMDRGHFTWGLEKNFDGSHPCGPYLVVGEGDPNALRCVTRVNGAVRQDFNTSDMIWTFADTVAHISHYMTLRPGDVFASGTGAGTAIEAGVDGDHWLQPGDMLEVEVEGAGVLRTRIGDWSEA